MAHDFFISYSRRDSELVQLFVDELTDLGYSVWIDKDGIESGDAFKTVIVRAIREARCVVFFSSKDSNTSYYTVKEVGIAIRKHIPVVPVKLDQSEYNESLEFDLGDLDYTDYSIPS
ncbi:MAG: toll/interleukin-1 receptor domain-containing protein, partial [Bacteroidales bacterium]|nr:toll/interleukin-1 receptor domain-containing protein [Bacteroidales bacterium]